MGTGWSCSDPSPGTGTEQGRAGPVAGWVAVLTALAKAGAKCWRELHSVLVSAGKKFQAAFGLWELQIRLECAAALCLEVLGIPWSCGSTEPVFVSGVTL